MWGQREHALENYSSYPAMDQRRGKLYLFRSESFPQTDPRFSSALNLPASSWSKLKFYNDHTQQAYPYYRLFFQIHFETGGEKNLICQLQQKRCLTFHNCLRRAEEEN